MSPVLYIFLYSPTKRWRGERNFLNGATHQFATFKTVLYTMNNSIRTIPWLQYAQLMILALRHNSSSSQHLCALPVQVTQSHSTDCLCGSHSIQTITGQLLHSPTASDAYALSQTLALLWGSHPASVPPPPGEGPVPLTLFFFHSFLHPNELCMDLYIPFQQSGTPGHSQLVRFSAL